MEYKNNYESVLIFRGINTEDEYKKAINEIIEKIKKLIEIEKVDEKGLRKLAYEVNKQKTGYFVVIYYKATSQAILEMERLYRINENIIKFITVKKDD